MASVAVLWLGAALAQAPGDAAPSSPPVPAPAPATSSAKCQEALVNPISGFAECVKPRGAAVAPPPKRPDAGRDTPEH
jgi:hypothetical protein